VYQELHLGMAGAVLLLVVGILKESTGEAVSRSRRTVVAAVSLGGLVLLVGLLARQTSSLLEGTVYVARNFFGVLRVQAVKSDTGAIRALELYDGAVLHGIQFLIPRLRSVPTTYYSELTGVGQVLRTYATTTGRRIGVVGLGAGVLAAYGRAGDVMRFYEINPNVVDVALNTFSFLKNSPARIETIIGDARLKLEQEPDQRFDILVLDAFSSDSIPVHLLTTEALVVYERHLAPGGVLLVHVSNLHLDLSALLHRQAAARKLPAIEFDNRARLDRATTPGRWVVLTHNQAFVDRLVAGMAPLIDSGDMQVFRRKPEDFAQLQPWSDDYSNLFQILN